MFYIPGRRGGREAARLLLLVEIVRWVEAEWAVHLVVLLFLRDQFLDHACRTSENGYFWLGVVHCVAPLLEYSAPIVLGSEDSCWLWLRSRPQLMLSRQ